jgi:hypothetical protein
MTANIQEMYRAWKENTHQSMNMVSVADYVRNILRQERNGRRQEAQVDARLKCLYPDTYDPPDPAGEGEDMNFLLNNLIIDGQNVEESGGSDGDEELRKQLADLRRKLGELQQRPPAQRNGLAKALAYSALAVGLIGTGTLGALGIAALSESSSKAAVVDSEYDVLFFDADGNPIKIPQVDK